MGDETERLRFGDEPLSAGQAEWRLFAAIRLPESVCASIHEVQQTLRRSARGSVVKWTGPEQWHVTLKFLGNVQAANVEALSSALGSVASGISPLSLSASGVGFFPQRGAPRVVWVGIHEPAERLTALHERVEAAVATFTNEPSESQFKSHVTLGRVKSITRADTDGLRQAAESFGKRSFGDWIAGGFELIRSELTSQGARYTTLAHLAFSQAP